MVSMLGRFPQIENRHRNTAQLFVTHEDQLILLTGGLVVTNLGETVLCLLVGL